MTFFSRFSVIILDHNYILYYNTTERVGGVFADSWISLSQRYHGSNTFLSNQHISHMGKRDESIKSIQKRQTVLFILIICFVSSGPLQISFCKVLCGMPWRSLDDFQLYTCCIFPDVLSASFLIFQMFGLCFGRTCLYSP